MPLHLKGLINLTNIMRAYAMGSTSQRMLFPRHVGKPYNIVHYLKQR